MLRLITKQHLTLMVIKFSNFKFSNDFPLNLNYLGNVMKYSFHLFEINFKLNED
jgi:hypothetical protein